MLQLCVWDFPSHHTWVDKRSSNQIWFCRGQCIVVNSNPLDSDTDPCSPIVYYCNISSLKSRVTSPVYMTPIYDMLAVFASKNKQVDQIRIQVSHVEAVSTRVEFGSHIYIWKYNIGKICTEVTFTAACCWRYDMETIIVISDLFEENLTVTRLVFSAGDSNQLNWNLDVITISLNLNLNAICSTSKSHFVDSVVNTKCYVQNSIQTFIWFWFGVSIFLILPIPCGIV